MVTKNIFAIIFSSIFSCFTIKVTNDNELRILQEPQIIDTTEYKYLAEKFNLFQITEPWGDLGGLSPNYPIAFGIKTTYTEKSLFTKGCMLPFCHILVVKKDNDYILLETQDDIKNFYAPIENEQEALSYAILSTGNSCKYYFDIKKRYKKYVKKINTTYVLKKDNGYEVSLFYYEVCGCGPHNHVNVKYLVKTNGEIEEIERTKLYSDPKLNGLCVD